MITLEEGVNLVWEAIEDMVGGEIYVKKIKSIKLTDIALAIDSETKQEVIGCRPGEKLHEQMISTEDSYSTYEYPGYYKILPQINDWAKDRFRIRDGKKVEEEFIYNSENNKQWMNKKDLKKWVDKNINFIGKI